MKKFFLLYLVIFSNLCLAEDDKLDFGSQLQSEYGTCFDKFDDNLQVCNPFICSFPDLTDAKAWKAQSIRGTYDDKCYVIYYRYVADKVLDEPLHCYYKRDTVDTLVALYKQLFKASSLDKAMEIKTQIAKEAINSKYCRTRNSTLSNEPENNNN